ncbi:putative xaa-Pro aminopeptidase [Rosa chinensis]|uniref:Putative xaa-Pro aminopeptidase n=1 Tax=Rosa chinensis TaxID=74649 RepID=A0A2P6RML9_ROSCH|nr:putative xaa-Pro aminopeptidase [Rosa chinensis]
MLNSGSAIGISPWCILVDTAQNWERAFVKNQQKLVQTSTNLVDEVWKSLPPQEISPVFIHPLEFAGRFVADKLKDVRKKLFQVKAHSIIILALDEVCWLYNIRRTDVDYSLVVHAFAIVTLNSAFFYVDKRKVSSEVNSYLETNGIEVWDYKAVSADVSLLASNQLKPSIQGKGTETALAGNGTIKAEESNNDLIWANLGYCYYALYSKLNPDKVLFQQSSLALAKALKNPIELEGLKNAHIRDGTVVVQYHVWLDKQEMYGASGFFLEEETDKKKQSQVCFLD